MPRPLRSTVSKPATRRCLSATQSPRRCIRADTEDGSGRVCSPRVATLSRCVDILGLNSAPITLEDEGHSYSPISEIFILVWWLVTLEEEGCIEPVLGRGEWEGASTFCFGLPEYELDCQRLGLFLA